MEIKPNLNIYPNPAESFVKISFSLPKAQDAEISLYDLNGKLVLQRNTESLLQGANEIILDVSGLPESIYFCHINAGEKKMVKKLIITR